MENIEYKEDRDEAVDKLKNHFSRNWNFEPMSYKNQIKFNFDSIKTRIKGRIYCDENKIDCEVYDKDFTYEYLNNETLPIKFLNAFISNYPYLTREYGEFTDWVEEWIKDKRKNNKPARLLYNNHDDP